MSDPGAEILITGSSRGIGRAIAQRVARDGFSVVVHCRNRVDDAEAVVTGIRNLGGHARWLQFDISDRDACRSVLEADVQAHGAYYGVVCNAGIHRDAAFPAFTDQDWDLVISTNLGGFYNVLRPLVMPMVRRRKPGRIVTMSSVAGLMGNRGQVNYSAAKAGIIGATKALALELAKREITVNCVAPGWIQTDWGQQASESWQQRAVGESMLGRWGTPQDIARVVAALSFGDGAFINGQTISVNGGWQGLPHLRR